MKSTILSLTIGSLVIVDNSKLAQVVSVDGKRGCKGDTKVTLTLRDGSELITGWREPSVNSLRVASLADCETYFTNLAASVQSITGGVDVVVPVLTVDAPASTVSAAVACAVESLEVQIGAETVSLPE